MQSMGPVPTAALVKEVGSGPIGQLVDAMGPDLAASVVHNMGVDLTAELVTHLGPQVAAGIVASAGGDTTGALVRAMGADFVAALVTKLGVTSNVKLVAELGPGLLAQLVAAMGPVFIGSLSLSMSSEIFHAIFGAVGNAVTGHGHNGEGEQQGVTSAGGEAVPTAGWMPGQQGGGVTSDTSDVATLGDQAGGNRYQVGTAAAPRLKATTISVTPLVGTSVTTSSSSSAGIVGAAESPLARPSGLHPHTEGVADIGLRRQRSAGSHTGAGLEGMPPVV